MPNCSQKSAASEPTVEAIALLAATLSRSGCEDKESSIRSAIELWKLSETKLAQLRRYEAEVSPKWREWLALDADEERRNAWLSGTPILSPEARNESAAKVEAGKRESEALGAHGPPARHSFALEEVADKILPQRNLSDRHQNAREFLA